MVSIHFFEDFDRKFGIIEAKASKVGLKFFGCNITIAVGINRVENQWQSIENSFSFDWIVSVTSESLPKNRKNNLEISEFQNKFPD